MAHSAAPIEDDDGVEKANQHLEAKDRNQRQQAAVAMRIAGANYSEIARALGYVSATQARQAVERSLAETVGTENREQLRFLEARRLERLLRSVWPKATSEVVEDDNGNSIPNEQHLPYVRAALAIIDRHARLYGLDAPQEMVIYNPSGAELEAWVAQMAAQVHGEFPEEYDVIEGQTISDDETGDEE